jgi:curved DNA-binding protein
MAVKFRDYYQTLGVGRDASAKEIQRAFRKLAGQFHPDVNKDAGAEARFKEVNEAYEVLSDPEKRKRYDALGENWKAGQEFRPPPGYDFRGDPREGGRFEFRSAGGQGFDFRPGGQFSDFFEMFFGRPGTPGGGPGSGGSVNLEELLRQAQTHAGGVSGSNGGASAHDEAQDVQAELTLTLEEAYLGGTRQLQLRGSDGATRTLDVKIPPGARGGTTMRLRGQGQAGGDLLIKLALAPHPRFTVDGYDLTTTVDVSPADAALGAKVEAPTLDGQVTLTVPAGTSSGTKLRLRGKGLVKRGGARGDLYVTLRIVAPRELSDEERKLYEKLRELSQHERSGGGD